MKGVVDSMTQPYGYIYLITNTVNGKRYVGQTKQGLKERFYQHKSASKRSQLPLSKAIRKYGILAFTIEELEQCPDLETLNLAEVKWIAYYDSTTQGFGYNCTSGGAKDFECSEVTKARISRARKELLSDPRFRDRISENQKRYIDAHPEEVTRLSAMSKAYNMSPEGRKRHSEILLANLAKPEVREHYRKAQVARCSTIEGRTHILRVAAKGRESIAAMHRAIRKGWVSESEMRSLIQNTTVKEYNVRRKGNPTLPKQSYFPIAYGKTFQEVRDGYRRGGIQCV